MCIVVASGMHRDLCAWICVVDTCLDLALPLELREVFICGFRLLIRALILRLDFDSANDCDCLLALRFFVLLLPVRFVWR